MKDEELSGAHCSLVDAKAQASVVLPHVQKSLDKNARGNKRKASIRYQSRKKMKVCSEIRQSFQINCLLRR